VSVSLDATLLHHRDPERKATKDVENALVSMSRYTMPAYISNRLVKIIYIVLPISKGEYIKVNRVDSEGISSPECKSCYFDSSCFLIRHSLFSMETS